MEKEMEDFQSNSDENVDYSSTKFDVSSEGLTSNNKKVREFKTFTNIKSVEERFTLTIKSFNLIDDKGNIFTGQEAQNIIASYQSSKAPQNAESLCKRVRKFLEDPNYSVNVRYAQSEKSPKQYAAEWMTRTLTHALFPIPEKFTFNKVLYTVTPIVKEVEFDITRISEVLDGSLWIRPFKLNSENDVIDPIDKQKIRVFVSKERFEQICNLVKSELQLSISEDGVISALGSPLMKWCIKSTSIIDAQATDISEVNLF